MLPKRVMAAHQRIGAGKVAGPQQLRLFPNVDGRRATFLSRTINDPSRSSIVQGGGKRRDVTATVWPGCSSPLHAPKFLNRSAAATSCGPRPQHRKRFSARHRVVRCLALRTAQRQFRLWLAFPASQLPAHAAQRHSGLDATNAAAGVLGLDAPTASTNSLLAF
jgi:hypothetical protein